MKGWAILVCYVRCFGFFFYCRDVNQTHRLIRVLLKQESSQPRGIGAGRKEIGVLKWERERERECDIGRTLEKHVGVRAFGSKQTAVCAEYT